MHKLLIEDDEGKTVAVPLIREEITIGRLEGNTIRLTEQNVSRKHARLSLKDGVLRIEDLGSYNGTSLNGSGLSGIATLKDGDVILIGDYRLGIQEDRTSQAAPSSSTQSMDSAPAVPSVEQAMDGQPTIPISTLVAQTAFAEPPARLVVMTRFMSGTEFLLDRPAQVIGRTPENDIIINHKSISRHHAKIIREGSRYTILDLESANGVRVGGAEHDRVELQSGDVLELGEVRLRFLSGDSALFEEPQPFYRNKKFMALAAGGGLLGLVLVFAFAGGSATKVASMPQAKPPVPPAAVQTPPTPAPPPPVATPEPVPPPPPAVPVEELLASAKKSADSANWDEALDLVAKALVQEPTSSEAAELRRSYTAEKTNRDSLAAAQAALENKSFEAVFQGVAAIPEESTYRKPAVELQKAAQGQFVALHLDEAKAKLADGNCDDARREAELVRGVDAKNKKAAVIVKRCEALAAKPEPSKPEPAVAAAKPAPVVAMVATKTPPRRVAAAQPAVRPAASKPRQAEPAKTEPAASAAADPDKLIKDAQQAWFRGQYASAIDSARKALRAKPNLTNAYQIIAVCSCALHDAESAVRAFDKLDERNKLYVKSSCQKNGINF